MNVRCVVKNVRVYTHNLLDDLARRVKVDETLVDLELVAVPGLGTLTARLKQGRLAT